MAVSLQPVRHAPSDSALADVLDLIRESFAYMDGRIDPPSSMHLLSLEDVARLCKTGEVWSLGSPPLACVFLTPEADKLYLGKLAVSAGQRRQGLAGQLVELAADRARALGLPALELQTRVELTENHATFARLGFVTTGETAHPGYDRPTSITMRRIV